MRRENHPWPVAAIHLLILTGARLSEIVNLKWDKIGEDGTSARLEESKTGPRTIWLGPKAAELLAALPRAEDQARVFPESLTPDHLYRFWCGVREEAGLPGLRIHDCRHTWASQGVMSGVGLTTVGTLLGHRRRETTAIYAHLDDGALRDAAAQAAAAIARAMEYRVEPPLSEEIAAEGVTTNALEFMRPSGQASSGGLRTPLLSKPKSRSAQTTQPKPGCLDRPGPLTTDVAGRLTDSDSDQVNEDDRERRRRNLHWI